MSVSIKSTMTLNPTRTSLFPVKQKFTLSGAEAAKQLNYVDYYPQGQNAQPQVCLAAGIEGFPTWEINRQIAQMSGCQNPWNFKNTVPQF